MAPNAARQINCRLCESVPVCVWVYTVFHPLHGTLSCATLSSVILRRQRDKKLKLSVQVEALSDME